MENRVEHGNSADDKASQPALVVGRVESDEDAAALLRILNRAFGMTPRDSERYEKLIGRANFRVVREGDTIVGGLAVIRMGQHFGGRTVSMAGIAAVGIAPWMRGRGAARTLMAAVLDELRSEGVAISTLYPATQTLYRSVGYEIAGSQYEITLPLNAIHVKDAALTVRPVQPNDESGIEAMYAAHAMHRAGSLSRNDVMWKRIRTPRGKVADGFVIMNGASPEGYVYFVQQRARNKPYSLRIFDLLATTPAATRRLLSFLAEHRSVGEEAIWLGSPCDSIVAALPENAWKIRLNMHWMVRILDVKAALETRGYAPSASGALQLEIEDDVLSANAGTWALHVQAGKASVTPSNTAGSGAALRLSARALAPLYTGFMSAHELATLGWLEARDDASLALANGLFAGPLPCMSDGF
jgi:predicted acetyltransferase